MTDTKYNGWNNYETWNANLWQDNEQSTQEWRIERAQELLTEHAGDKDDAAYELAQALQERFEEGCPELSASPYSDLLNAAMRVIDWREIADCVLENIEHEVAA